MIRVQRSPEPQALNRARSKQLTKASDAYAAQGAPSRELTALLTGYDVMGVKETLFSDQHKKCAWCETRARLSSSPIEHYRPEDGAWRNLPHEPRSVSAGHYWWLTWTWENLFFACPRCNDQGHKANYFPLEGGTTEALVPPGPLLPNVPFDLSGERPLLLDPAVDDFLDHVRWVPANTNLARQLWTWSPKHLTERGRATIAILKLTELADEFQSHLVDYVLPRVEEVEQHMRGRRTQQAAVSWNKLIALLAPEKSFTAATWCALDRWIDAATLATWNLSARLPAPPRPR